MPQNATKSSFMVPSALKSEMCRQWLHVSASEQHLLRPALSLAFLAYAMYCWKMLICLKNCCWSNMDSKAQLLWHKANTLRARSMSHCFLQVTSPGVFWKSCHSESSWVILICCHVFYLSFLLVLSAKKNTGLSVSKIALPSWTRDWLLGAPRQFKRDKALTPEFSEAGSFTTQFACLLHVFAKSLSRFPAASIWSKKPRENYAVFRMLLRRASRWFRGFRRGTKFQD